LGNYFHVDGKQLQQQYKDHLSDYHQWSQLIHAHEWILFENNIGPFLTIDETSLSQGELYTIVTNKAAKGKRGALVAMVKGTKAQDVINILMKIPEYKRKKVREVTLDMAPNMEMIIKRSFPNASRVTDRFHVQQLASEGVQQMRIAYRWQAIEEESMAMKKAKESNVNYEPEVFENGDTLKQLLARSRYLLFKRKHKWTPSQEIRAKILFDKFPDLKKAYKLSMKLSYIFDNTYDKGVALTKLARWYDEVEKAGFQTFQTIANSIEAHYQTILNFFINRSTNAAAESFNAKIKAFRATSRGVRDVRFFLFRLAKIYA